MQHTVETIPRMRVPPEWIRERATVSPVAWQPKVDLDCADWIMHGKRLGSIGRGIAWWIGDWVNYGNAKFGEKYSRAAQITGYDVQTLMNMAYVASRFDPARRRVPLSWSHHAEVSSLEVADQDTLLAFAEQTNLSVRGLRDELRARGLKPDNRKKKNSDNAEGKPPPDGAKDQAVCPNCGCRLVADEGTDTAAS